MNDNANSEALLGAAQRGAPRTVAKYQIYMGARNCRSSRRVFLTWVDDFLFIATMILV